MNHAENMQHRKDQKEQEKFDRLKEESSKWWDELMDSQEEAKLEHPTNNSNKVLDCPSIHPHGDRILPAPFDRSLEVGPMDHASLPPTTSSSSTNSHRPPSSLSPPSIQPHHSTHIHPHIRDVLAIAQALRHQCSPVHPNAYIRARDLHKEIFTHCIRESSTMTPFIRGEHRASGEIYINARYNTLMRQVDDLSLTEKWEMLVLAFNLVSNLHQRALQFKPRQLSLAAMCDDLYSRRLNSEVNGEGFKAERYVLAQQIFNLDEQQETLFKQIERAGFELTTKLPVKIGAILRTIGKGDYGGAEDEDEVQAARKAVKSRLHALRLEVDTISTEFKDVMHYAKIGKGGRGGIVNLCKTFETCMDKTVEDVVDEEDDDGSDDSHDNEYEEEGDEYAFEEDVKEENYRMDDAGRLKILSFSLVAKSSVYKSYFTKKPHGDSQQEIEGIERFADESKERRRGYRKFRNRVEGVEIERGKGKSSQAPISAWLAVKSTMKKHKENKENKIRKQGGLITTSEYDSDVEQDLIRNCVKTSQSRSSQRDRVTDSLEALGAAVDNLHISKETFELTRMRNKTCRTDMNIARIVHEKPSLVNEILDGILVIDSQASNAPNDDVLVSLLQVTPGEFSISSSTTGKEVMYNFLNSVWNSAESALGKIFYSLDLQEQDEFIASFLTHLYSHLHQNLSLSFEQIALCSNQGDNLSSSSKDAIVKTTENLIKSMVCILFDESLLFTYLSLKRSLTSRKSSEGEDDNYLVYVARMSEIMKKMEQGLVSISYVETNGTASGARSSIINAWFTVLTHDESNSLYASLYSYAVGSYLQAKLQYNHRVLIKLQSIVVTRKAFKFMLILYQMNENMMRNVFHQLAFCRDLLFSVIVYALQPPAKSVNSTKYRSFEISHALLVVCMLVISYSEKLSAEIGKQVREHCKPPMSLSTKATFIFQVKFFHRMLHYVVSAINSPVHGTQPDNLNLHDALRGTEEERQNDAIKLCESQAVSTSHLTRNLCLQPDDRVLLTISAEQVWLILGLCVYIHKSIHVPVVTQPSIGLVSNGWYVAKWLSEQFAQSVRKVLCTTHHLAFNGLSKLYAYGVTILSRLPKLCGYWDSKPESYGIFIDVTNTLASLHAHIKKAYERRAEVGNSLMSLVEERKKLVHLSAFVSSSLYAVRMYDHDAVYLYDINDSKVFKSALHNRLLQVVSLLFIRCNVYNPYAKYLQSFLKEATNSLNLNLPTSLEEDPLGEGLDRVRQYLQELLQSCVVDPHSSPANSNANTLLCRKLRLSIGMENKNLFSIVNGIQNSTENMLLLLLCIKELCHVYDSYTLIKEFNYVDLVIQHISSQPIYKDPANVHSEAESNLLRSCLIFFTSCIVFNPFPIPGAASPTNTSSAITTEYGSLFAFIKLQSLLLSMQQLYCQGGLVTGQEEMVHTLVLYGMQCSMAIVEYLVHFIQPHLEASTDESMMQLYEQFVTNYARLLANFVHTNVNTGSSKVAVKEYSCIIVNHLYGLTSCLSMHVEAAVVHRFVLGFPITWQQTWVHSVYVILFGAPMGGLMPHMRVVLSALLRQCNECTPSYMLSCSISVPSKVYHYSSVLTNHPLNLLIDIYAQEVVLRMHLLQSHQAQSANALFDSYGQLMVALNANLKEDNYSVIFCKFLLYLIILSCIHDYRSKPSHVHIVACLDKWLDIDKRKDILFTSMAVLIVYRARPHLFIGDRKENTLERFIQYVHSIISSGAVQQHHSLPFVALLRGFQELFSSNQCIENLCDISMCRIVNSVYHSLVQAVYGSRMSNNLFIKEVETMCLSLNLMICRALRHIQHCIFQHPSNHTYHTRLSAAYEELVRGYVLLCNHTINIRDLRCTANCLPLCSVEVVASFCEEFLGNYVEGVCTLLLTPSLVPGSSMIKVNQYLHLCAQVYLHMIPNIPFATRCAQWEILLAPLFVQDDMKMFRRILMYWAVLISLPRSVFFDTTVMQRLSALNDTATVGEDQRMIRDAVVDLQGFFAANAGVVEFIQYEHNDVYDSFRDYLVGHSSPLCNGVGNRYKTIMNLSTKVDLGKTGEDLREALRSSVSIVVALHLQVNAA